MDIQAGTYRGRGIAGSEQYGVTSKGNDQIVLDLELLDIGARVSTFLIFTDNSAEYELARLRALGWQGNDLGRLAGIDANEVEVEVKYEEYQGKQQMKVQIHTGGGRVVLKQPMDDKAKRAFGAKFAKLAATIGNGAPKPAPDAGPTGETAKPLF